MNEEELKKDLQLSIDKLKKKKLEIENMIKEREKALLEVKTRWIK